MKRRLKSIALLAALSFAAAGCQKEPIVEPSLQCQQNADIRNIRYSVDGMVMYVTIRGEKEWLSFLDRMVALTKDGHQVSIKCLNSSNEQALSKNVVTYTTDNERDAIAWCTKMIGEGYDVTMNYDEKSGKYICNAEK